eukprot:scaffold2.g6906.t1
MDVDLRRALGLDQESQEDNCVSYELYPAAADGASSAAAASAASLLAARAQLMHHLLPFLEGFIWQRDRFHLRLSTARQPPWRRQRRRAAAVSSGADEEPPCLWGSLSFGDNIEDEWFVTWLLLEATRAFPGLVARAWDNDGEFLLIEAAYFLPRWLKPESAQNRVWLARGAFHLLPPPRVAGDATLPPSPSVRQALAAVRGGGATAAPPRMAAALAARVAGFPRRAAVLMHRAAAALPEPLVRLLGAEPQLVAAAAEAFHYRDLDDMKAAARMAAFPPAALAPASVRLSRCLYAQVALQEYAPPRGYPLPLPSDPGYAGAELGMKLAAGFEMVVANRARFGRPADEEEEEEQAGAPAAAPRQQGGAPSGGSPSGALAALEGDAGWRAVRGWLERRGELGEAEQLRLAAERYRRSVSYQARTRALAAPALLIDALLGEQAAAAAAGAAPPLPRAEALPPPDSDAWLREGAEEVERELAQRQAEAEAEARRQERRRAARGAAGAAAAAGEAGAAVGQPDFDPRQISASLRAFVEAAAGLEGAELPGDVRGGTRGGGGGGAGEQVDLQAGRFAEELEKTLGLKLGALGLDGEEEEDRETSEEEGSSFYSGGSSDSEEEDGGSEGDRRSGAAEHPAAPRPTATAAAASPTRTAAAAWRQRRQAAGAGGAGAGEQEREQERWEVDTATDSDDEGEAFMEAYSKALDRQLAGTHMAESFERAPRGATQRPAAQQTAARQPPAGAAAAGGEQAAQEQAGEEQGAPAGDGEKGEEGEEMQPVDVDVNLVSSLLASYSGQQGLPGPAGNLAGLLGLRLPRAGEEERAA